MISDLAGARGISKDSNIVTRKYVNTFSLLLVLEPRSYSLRSQILLQLDILQSNKNDQQKLIDFIRQPLVDELRTFHSN